MRKRFLAIGLIAALALTLAACGGGKVANGTYIPDSSYYGIESITFSDNSATLNGYNTSYAITNIKCTYKISGGKLILTPNSKDDKLHVSNIFGKLGGQIVSAPNSSGYASSCSYERSGTSIILGGHEFTKQ